MAVWKRGHENRRHYHSECGIIESFNLLVIITLVLILPVYKGFDEFMNLVMDDAMEVYMKKDYRRQIGQFKSS